MDKWFKDILPDKDPYHNRGRDQMRKKGVRNSSACGVSVRHFGTKTNRHPDNSASQLDKSALVFFSLISLPLIVIVCILRVPVFYQSFFFLKSCFDLFDKSL